MPKRSTVLPPVPLRKPAAVLKPISPFPPLKPGSKPSSDSRGGPENNLSWELMVQNASQQNGPFRTVKEMHETLYHFHEPRDEEEADAWLMNFLVRYNAMEHRSELHSRMEDWWYFSNRSLMNRRQPFSYRPAVISEGVRSPGGVAEAVVGGLGRDSSGAMVLVSDRSCHAGNARASVGFLKATAPARGRAYGMFRSVSEGNG